MKISHPYLHSKGAGVEEINFGGEIVGICTYFNITVKLKILY